MMLCFDMSIYMVIRQSREVDNNLMTEYSYLFNNRVLNKKKVRINHSR